MSENQGFFTTTNELLSLMPYVRRINEKVQKMDLTKIHTEDKEKMLSIMMDYKKFLTEALETNEALMNRFKSEECLKQYGLSDIENKLPPLLSLSPNETSKRNSSFKSKQLWLRF